MQLHHSSCHPFQAILLQCLKMECCSPPVAVAPPKNENEKSTHKPQPQSPTHQPTLLPKDGVRQLSGGAVLRHRRLDVGKEQLHLLCKETKELGWVWAASGGGRCHGRRQQRECGRLIHDEKRVALVCMALGSGYGPKRVQIVETKSSSRPLAAAVGRGAAQTRLGCPDRTLHG